MSVTLLNYYKKILLIFVSFFFIGSTVSKALHQIVATLLVLNALSDSFPQEFGIVIEARVRISDNTIINKQYSIGVEKAIAFVGKTDKAFPSLCARLELGYNWGAAIQGIISTV